MRRWRGKIIRIRGLGSGFRGDGQNCSVTLPVFTQFASLPFVFLCALYRLQKRFSLLRQTFFQPFGAIAMAARPRFGAIFVPAILAIVRVPDAQQLKKFLPVRPFLRQRRGAETGFHPMCDTVLAGARLLHVVVIFVASNRTPAKRAVGDRLQQRLFPSGLHAGFNQITHGERYTKIPAGRISQAGKWSPAAGRFSLVQIRRMDIH